MRYFAHGSNLDPSRMEERRIIFSKRMHAYLWDYALRAQGYSVRSLLSEIAISGNIGVKCEFWNARY